MITTTTILIAFVSGVFGCAVGGTPSFIFASIITIISQILTYLGISTAVMDLYATNLFFLPAVCFTGGAAGAAFAARKHNIKGYNTWNSIAAFNDPLPLIVGGLAAVLGYMIFRGAVVAGIPCDQGALSVLTMGILIRLTMSTERKYDPAGPRILASLPVNVWITHILIAVCLGLAGGYFAELTGIWSIGFGVSGLSLLFAMAEPNFPASHHITLVAGYAMQVTHNLWIAVLFAVISELICYIFTILYNNKCSTHIDGPALGIFLCSLILFTLF